MHVHKRSCTTFVLLLRLSMFLLSSPSRVRIALNELPHVSASLPRARVSATIGPANAVKGLEEGDLPIVEGDDGRVRFVGLPSASNQPPPDAFISATHMPVELARGRTILHRRFRQRSMMNISSASCLPGRYNRPHKTSDGLTRYFCAACPPGRYQTAVGYKWHRICMSCPEGKFSKPGQTRCRACSRGHFADRNGLAACMRCTHGLIAPTNGLSSCVPCTNGTVADVRGEICLCPTITQFLGSDGACHKCPHGKIQRTAPSSLPKRRGWQGGKNSSCVEMCRAGSHVAKQQKCELCSVGRAQAHIQQRSCRQCVAGRFAAKRGLARCASCPAGKWGKAPGDQLCTWCPKGMFQSRSGQTRCIYCPRGKYNEFDLGVRCVGCNPGHFLAAARDRTRNSCRSCPYGQEQPLSAQTACIKRVPIPPPTPVPTPSYWAAPTPLPSPAPTLSQWIFYCPVGKFRKSSKCGDCACQNCPAGRFQPGGRRCMLCPRGKFQSRSGMAICINCPHGKYQFGDGQPSCKTLLLSRAPTPVPTLMPTPPSPAPSAPDVWLRLAYTCPMGKFREAGGHHLTCVPCPVGKFQDFRHTAGPVATACYPCPRGKFQPMPNNVQCFQCPSGKYSGITEAKRCKYCPLGQFQASAGKSFCTVMHIDGIDVFPPRRDTPTPAPVMCPSGRFVKALFRDTRKFNRTFTTIHHMCAACPRGKYRDTQESGLVACTPCVAGQYQSRNGAKTCERCRQGRFTGYSAAGARRCNDHCAAGTFGRNQQCIPCQPGMFSAPSRSQAAAVQCTTCPRRTFQSRYGASSCTSCPLGKYQLLRSQTSCLVINSNCWPGKYAKTQVFHGKIFSRCFGCSAGRFQMHRNKMRCEVCTPGKYQGSRAQQTCHRCPRGKFQHANEQRACRSCPAGKYQSRLGKGFCSVCPHGKYQKLAAQSQCFDQGAAGNEDLPLCTPGKFTALQSMLTGGDACIDCPAGRFSSKRGAYQCKRCPVGKYSGLSGAYFCFAWKPTVATPQQDPKQKQLHIHVRNSKGT